MQQPEQFACTFTKEQLAFVIEGLHGTRRNLRLMLESPETANSSYGESVQQELTEVNQLITNIETRL